MTLGEKFPGNLFVDANDPRILRAREPRVIDPHVDLEAFTRETERVHVVSLPLRLGQVSEVLLKDSFDVPPTASAVTLLFSVAGQGHIEGEERIEFPPETLVVARTSPALKVVADGGEPIVFYLIRIPKKES